MTNQLLDPDELVAKLREYDDLLKELRRDADLCRRFSQQTWPICGQAADRIEALQSLLNHPLITATINMNAHHPDLIERAAKALDRTQDTNDA